MALWYLGYPDQALQRSQQAVTLAQELSHPFSLAFALEGVAEIYQFRREAQQTQEGAEALMTLSTEQRFAFWLVSATVLRGWALAEQGQGAEGMAQIRQGLAAWQAMGEALYQPRFRALLAEIYGNVGQPEAGLTVLAEVLAEVHTNGLCYCEAELYRLKGILLQAMGGSGEAEACFQQALDRCPPPAGQILGAARGHEPGAAVAAAGQTGRGPRASGAGLRLVHRGL